MLRCVVLCSDVQCVMCCVVLRRGVFLNIYVCLRRVELCCVVLLVCRVVLCCVLWKS